MKSSLLVNNNQNLFAINNLIGLHREYMFGVFCNMFRRYVIISFFLTIKYHFILTDLINKTVVLFPIKEAYAYIENCWLVNLTCERFYKVIFYAT